MPFGISLPGGGGGGSGNGIRKVADAAARIALVPTDGDFVIQLDNDEVYYWDGAAWVIYLADTDHADLATVIAGLAAHLADATDSHDASSISSVAAGNLAATDVQAALNELQSDIDARALASDLTNHLNDTVGSHDASSISSVAAGNLASTDVQSALNELQSDIDTRALASDLTNHLNDTVAAHDASAISVVPTGNLASTDVQAALQEHQGDIDTLTAASHAAVTLAAFGSTPNTNGLSLSTQALNMQPADDTNPGGVSTAQQNFGGAKAFGAGIRVGATGAPTTSTVFDVQSTTLFSIPMPVMTTTQRNAIASPATGMMLYNSTAAHPEFYNGSVFEPIGHAYVNSAATISAAGTITPVNVRKQLLPVTGNAAAVTAAEIDATNAKNGDELLLIGGSDTNTVTIVSSTNVQLNGSCTLASGECLTLVYLSSQWREVSRSN